MKISLLFPKHHMNPHLPISKSSHCNCSNSMQSCSSFIQGSIGSGFGGGYAGHRRDVRNGSFESTQIYAEYRSLSWTCGLSISAHYLVSIASSGASDKSFLLCFFFFIFQDKNKTQIVGGGAPIVFNSKLFSSSLWKGGESILV